MTGLSILGIGTSVPAYSMSQQEAAELAKKFCCKTEEEERRLETLYLRTQIQRRGSVLLKENSQLENSDPFVLFAQESGPSTRQRMERYKEKALPLARAAARQAFDESHTSSKEITHLVTVSCTGFAAPGVDINLIKDLNLSRDVSRTHIGFMGCHGALNGLRVASALAQATPESRVLLSAVELCSLHFYYGWDQEKIVANGLFADGSAALVAASSDSVKRKHWRLAASGAHIFPGSQDAMKWSVGDFGFEMELSPELPQLISSQLRPWLARWLEKESLEIEKVQSWAVHPGGPRILQSVGESLGLSEEALIPSKQILMEHGNMSSPTLLFILDRLGKQTAALPCVALGFGPGLAVEAALFL